jgi:hypothetical protein
MEISSNARAVLARLAHLTMADATLPMTAAAGGTREVRQGVAELRKAGLVSTFTNKFTPAGHMVVRETKAGKQMAATLGIQGFNHAGYYRTAFGTYIHTS